MNLDFLLEDTDPGTGPQWATVTGTAPLRILLDGDDDPWPFAPEKLISGLAVADRVLVIFLGNPDAARRSRRVVIIGKSQ